MPVTFALAEFNVNDESPGEDVSEELEVVFNFTKNGIRVAMFRWCIHHDVMFKKDSW
jgi:hypothetical protein